MSMSGLRLHAAVLLPVLRYVHQVWKWLCKWKDWDAKIIEYKDGSGQMLVAGITLVASIPMTCKSSLFFFSYSNFCYEEVCLCETEWKVVIDTGWILQNNYNSRWMEGLWAQAGDWISEGVKWQT